MVTQTILGEKVDVFKCGIENLRSCWPAAVENEVDSVFDK